ncbi:MAG TPA: MarR family transcriptional regulator [Blastocatellia bacterium]|nr:MarR family transcriptional regulator [Blastocatellia bacterium]
MKLARELKLKQPLASLNHETLLNLVRTAAMIQKLSDRFFSRFGLTDVQFNILMILRDDEAEGLSQQGLSERLIVTKSNVVGLVDRLENAGYVKRDPHPEDRRFNQIVLTPKGRKLVERVEEAYFREVDRMMDVLAESQKRTIILAMERLRQYMIFREE